MSFSFSITEADVESTLGAAVDDKIVALPEGPGKEEASRLADVIPSAIVALGKHHEELGYEFASASISGSASSNQAHLTVSVNFKTLSAKGTES